MQHSIPSKLDELKLQISGQSIPSKARDWEEWGGADVMILGRMDQSSKDWVGTQPIVISAQKLAPKRRVVVTKFSRELSWLYCQLRDIFSERIDYVSKYDFYGLLAQSAIEYLERNQGTETSTGLLIAVVEQAESRLGEELGGGSTVH